MTDSSYKFDLIERTPSNVLVDEDGSPLAGYKTNDIFWRKPDEEHQIRINTKVLGCGTLSVILLAGVIAAVVWGTGTTKTVVHIDYDHSKVRVSTSKTLCSYARNCTPECDNIQAEHALGCCTGCGLPDTCSFSVNVSWYNVPALAGPQRVWLFATLDGHYFFQSGFAPYITNNTGSYTIQDGCFGQPGNPIILVACLTTKDLQDKSFEGFPDQRCNSTWGLCTASQNILIQPLQDYCIGTQWQGNFFIQTWDGPRYASAVINLPSIALLMALLCAILVV